MAAILYLLLRRTAQLVARRSALGRDAGAGAGDALSVWLIYAAGLKYLLLSMILHAPGSASSCDARRQRGLPAFGNRAEAASRRWCWSSRWRRRG